VRRVILIFAAALALAGCGGSDDQEEPQSRQTERPQQKDKAPGAEAPDAAVVRANLNRVVAECEVRRAKAKAGDVGPFSKRLEEAARALVVEFRQAPDKRFTPRTGEDPTTMRRIMRRLEASFGQEAPRGCGANTEAGRETRQVVRSIRRALAQEKSP